MAKETLKYSFDLDEHYILADAMRRYAESTTGWTCDHRERITNLLQWFIEGQGRLEKPAREEQILTQAAAILRERGITSWNDTPKMRREFERLKAQCRSTSSAPSGSPTSSTRRLSND